MATQIAEPRTQAVWDFRAPFELVGQRVPMPAWKRTIDVILAAAGLFTLSPLFVLISIAIVVDTKGSPFFRQTRVGVGGRTFTFWKFRSMRPDAETLKETLETHNEAGGHIFKMKNDPRITRVGRILRKSSLDELPQLWNVLRGDMSLVGPRPPTAEEVAKYEPGQLRRLASTPGITGLWQVTARERHDFNDMVELDIEYAERMSPLLDARIMFKTIPTVLTGRGAY